MMIGEPTLIALNDYPALYERRLENLYLEV